MRLTQTALKSLARRWKDAGEVGEAQTVELGEALHDIIFLSRSSDQLSQRSSDPDVREMLSWATAQDCGRADCPTILEDADSEKAASQRPSRFFAQDSFQAADNPINPPSCQDPATSNLKPEPRKRLAQVSGQRHKKPALPDVKYSPENHSKRSRSGSQTRLPGPRPKRSHRQKQAFKAKINREVETISATQGLNARTDLPIASTGWMGLRACIPPGWARILRAAHQSDKEVWEFLDKVKFLPYSGNATQVLDAERRRVIFRSKITPGMARLAVELGAEAAKFVKACKPPSASDIAGNSRGRHWFCIAGADRNNKSTPALSKWHVENKSIIKEYFAPKRVFHRTNAIANDLVAQIFPAIAARYLACAEYMRIHNKMAPIFGLFWNWCLNAPIEGVRRVYCNPHVDFKNLALGVCVVFVYGVFNHREKSWLVIWEAGLCLELPPGVFLIYPSSLFYHFNVDIVTTADGARPTPENSKPLVGTFINRPDGVSEQDWAEGNGRGSVVWFNQASMFQTSETGYKTIAVARRAGHSGKVDVETLYAEQGAFPTL